MRGPLTKRQPGTGGGQSLPPGPRARAERSLGVPLSSVRVQRDSGEAKAMGAAGVSRGQQILLGPGADDATLAHELVHVAQGARHGTLAGAAPTDTPGSGAEAEADRLAPSVLQGAPAAVKQPRDARAHRKKDKDKKAEPDIVVVPVGGNQGSLANYPLLRAALDPADWNALSAAARRRGEIIAGDTPDTAKDEAVKNEVTVPLQRLIRPPMAMASPKTGSDAMQRDVYQMALSGQGPGALGARIQKEILGIWVEGDSGILTEPVTVALVDPEAKGKGGASLLFSIRGNPVPSADGSLAISAVDEALNGYLTGIVSMIESELVDLEPSANAAIRVQAALSAGRDIAGRKNEDLAQTTLDEISAALQSRADELGKVSAQPYASLAAPLLGEIRGYIGGDFAKRKGDFAEWLAKVDPKLSPMATNYKVIEDTTKKGVPQGFEAIAFSYAVQNTGYDAFTGFSGAQEHEASKAVGKTITLNQYNELAEAIEHRGMVIGLVNSALMIATMGLGGIGAVGELGLGGSMLLGGGIGIVTATAPMLAGNFYTSSTDLSDPQMQAWWKGSAYSTTDIVKAGLIGGGLGAAFPLAGKALSAIGGRGAAPLLSSAAPLESELTSLEGVAVRSLPNGASELTIASEGIVIERADGMVRVFGPAGNAKRVLLSSFRASELSDAAPGAMTGGKSMAPPGPINLLGDNPGGISTPPFRLGVGMNEPWLPNPTGGTGGPKGMIIIPSGGGGGPRMVPTASGGMSMAGPGDMTPMIMPGADGPVPFMELPGVAQPPAVLPGAEPFAPMVDLPGPVTNGPAYLPGLDPTAGGGMSFPGMPGAPMLTSGVQYIGPITPDTFRSPLMIRGGRPVSMMQLPQTALGGLWIMDGSGVWRYVAYPGSPGDAPGGITNYGVGDQQDLVLNLPGLQGALVQPNEINFGGGRGYPMTTADMRYGSIVLARSHLGPHADTKTVLPGGTVSTRDPQNYVGHPRSYNERIRRTLEGRLRKDGSLWSAYDELGDAPRLTQGGFTVPDAETIIQYGADGQPVRAWRFPFDNLTAYDNLGGNIDDILTRYEISPKTVPTGRTGR